MTEYEKAVQAMKWLRENTYTHYIDDESGKKWKAKGGRFSVRIEMSEEVSGRQLIKMAEDLGWRGE